MTEEKQTDLGFEMNTKEEEEPLYKKGEESLIEGDPVDIKNGPKSVRQTWVRWVMLLFGCLFLMGSYYCYDIPAALQGYLTDPPFSLNNSQYNMLYTVYSAPNMFLPLFGGVFLDKLGVRIGLIMFTVILTAGQFLFSVGCANVNYGTMLAGRVVFGLGGECMSVAQSAIVANWFKGKELAFAFGINLSVARLGSVGNGATQPSFAREHSVGFASFMGFGVCCISLCSAIILVFVDRWAEKKDKSTLKLSDEDKFKISDLGKFKLPYWLLTASCLFIYMTIFPFIWLSNSMLVDKYGFNKDQAGFLYSTPYIISAVASPFLGLALDKLGRRAIFITSSSVIIFLACVVSICLPTNPPGAENYIGLVPLCILGVGYSIYAAAIWGSIPYVVEPRTLGTAFGLTTSLQNVGLVIAPLAVGYIQDNTTRGQGFFWPLVLLATFSALGFIINIILYFDDINNRGGALNKVSHDQPLADLMTSPEANTRRQPQEGGQDTLEVEWDPTQARQSYQENTSQRDALKRSLAKAH